jgi:hypothetical protein
MTPDEVIRLNAQDASNKLAKVLPADVGFVLVLFHKSGEQGQYLGTNVANQQVVRILEKARDATICDSSRLVTA